jgi:hypothetical protein
MSKPHPKLSASSIAVLEMIAAGSSYRQILTAYPELTYLDIFHAAKESLLLLDPTRHRSAYTLAQKRQRYPRAYEKWNEEEDGKLREFVNSGGTVAQIARRLQRNRGAIRSRIMKLNLVNELSPKERDRLQYIVNRCTVRQMTGKLQSGAET